MRKEYKRLILFMPKETESEFGQNHNFYKIKIDRTSNIEKSIFIIERIK